MEAEEQQTSESMLLTMSTDLDATAIVAPALAVVCRAAALDGYAGDMLAELVHAELLSHCVDYATRFQSDVSHVVHAYVYLLRRSASLSAAPRCLTVAALTPLARREFVTALLLAHKFVGGGNEDLVGCDDDAARATELAPHELRASLLGFLRAVDTRLYVSEEQYRSEALHMLASVGYFY